MESEKSDLKSILTKKEQNRLISEQQPQKQLRPSEWVEIRLFISSTFVDTHSERDLLIKTIIPELNQTLKDRCITIVPVDLRWGVFGERSKDCYAIQKTCLNEIDNCRQNKKTYPYFIGFRTQRYGWVQNVLLEKDGYENPDLFGWVETLQKHKMEVSITSLECIHGSSSVEQISQAPTVFFYEREITNKENIEEEHRWLFDLEYRTKDMGPQYKKTEKAEMYANDKEQLNDYLQSLNEVKYSKYKCSYDKEGTRFTGNDGDKKFGIGKVKGLEELRKLVKEDLLNAIDKNFKEANLSEIPANEQKNLPYEEAMRVKASTFVERVTLTEEIHTFCTAPTAENSVMIVVGEPGYGKSALMASVANECINDMRSEKTFVFFHGVDTCPQSSDLEQMLLRLHDNLCAHVKIENTLKTSEDLKSKHLSQMVEIVGNHPDHKFIVFVDAVNQFHDSMQAHKMWWLPCDKTAENLRFVISTLPDENNTFANAQKQCSKAKVVTVEKMRMDEGEAMVVAILDRYNKRLTTDDSNTLLKNQMKLLLNKNCTPLYLSAACEALRTLGVYEELTKEIEKFPPAVPDLFSYLLDRWTDEYGEDFICYLMCVITLSRDGLLENVISDILSYIEEKMNIKFEFSFSHVFSSIRGFLSGGGGGNLRFFHDQLNQVVQRRYLSSSREFEREVHEILTGFYFEQIQSQLCDKAVHPPPMHYSDCLRHVVHHQVLAMESGEETDHFEQTLRNIFFVREKIKEGQLNELIKDYLFSLQYATDELLRNALQKWMKFVVIYAPFIKELPEWSYNMAINQVPSSYVYKDTKKLDVEVEYNELFPTYWVNKPTTEKDHVLLKYMSGKCETCATTTVKGNMVALAVGIFSTQICVYNMTTCELISQCHTKSLIQSMTFSENNQILVGDFAGCVHIYDITTGKLVWSSKKIGEEEDDSVLWLKQCNDNPLCGTRDGTVASICTTTTTITNTWKTGEKTLVYHYHHTSQLLYTGHKSSLKFWKLDGVVVRSVYMEGVVYCLDVHPTKENTMACCIYKNDEEEKKDEDEDENEKLIQLDLSRSVEVMWEVKGTRSNVVYTHDGERAVCVDRDGQTLILLDGEGNITNKVNGHTDRIKNIRLVPGTNQLLTAGRDGSYLFNLPTTPDQQHEDDDKQYEVVSFEVLNNRNEIILLKRDKDWKGIVERCHGDSFEILANVEVKGELIYYSSFVAHPANDDIIVVCTKCDLLFLDAMSLETIVKHNVVSEGELDSIYDFNICNDGATCVVRKSNAGALVLDITNIDTINTVTTIKMGGNIYSTAINHDGSKVVCGGFRKVVLYDVTTSQPIKTLSTKETPFFMRFVYQPDGILFVDGDDKLHLMNLDGVLTHSFNGKHISSSPTLLNNPYIITGNQDSSLQIHNITTGQTVYKFYHPSSQGFRSFCYQPEHNKLFALNKNGKLYVFKYTEF